MRGIVGGEGYYERVNMRGVNTRVCMRRFINRNQQGRKKLVGSITWRRTAASIKFRVS